MCIEIVFCQCVRVVSVFLVLQVLFSYQLFPNKYVWQIRIQSVQSFKTTTPVIYGNTPFKEPYRRIHPGMFQEVYVTGFIKVRFRGIIKRDKRTPPSSRAKKVWDIPPVKLGLCLQYFDPFDNILYIFTPYICVCEKIHVMICISFSFAEYILGLLDQA